MCKRKGAVAISGILHQPGDRATPHTMNGPSPHNEVQRAQSRRRELRISRPLVPGVTPPDPRSQWGLALSGGGIRSATFCLGVAQALARSDTPGAPGRPNRAGPGLC